MRIIIYTLLTAGLLAGASAASMQCGPPAYGLALLCLILGGLGLLLLHYMVFVPISGITNSLKAFAESGSFAPVQVRGDECKALYIEVQRCCERCQHELDATREKADDAVLCLDEWHEKYTLVLTGQQMLRENLNAVTTRAQKFSFDLGRQFNTLAQASASLAGRGELEMSLREALACSRQLLEKFHSDLTFLNGYMEQLTKITEGINNDNTGFTQSSRIGEVVSWSDSLATNIEAIDGQHKLLLTYINKLHRSIEQNCSKNVLLEVLDALAGYAFTHFNTEEIFFTNSKYPDVEKHIQIHEKFKQQVVRFREAVTDGKARVDQELLHFLKVWLVEHIEGMDVGFAPYVSHALKEMADTGNLTPLR